MKKKKLNCKHLTMVAILFFFWFVMIYLQRENFSKFQLNSATFTGNVIPYLGKHIYLEKDGLVHRLLFLKNGRVLEIEKDMEIGQYELGDIVKVEAVFVGSDYNTSCCKNWHVPISIFYVANIEIKEKNQTNIESPEVTPHFISEGNVGKAARLINQTLLDYGDVYPNSKFLNFEDFDAHIPDKYLQTQLLKGEKYNIEGFISLYAFPYFFVYRIEKVDQN